MAIKFPSYDILLYIRTYAGSSVEFGQRGTVFMKDSWNSTLTAYPAQGVVTDLKVRDNMRAQFNKIEQLFPTGSTVFFIGNPYAGSEGTVLDPMLVYSCGRVQGMCKVNFQYLLFTVVYRYMNIVFNTAKIPKMECQWSLLFRHHFAFVHHFDLLHILCIWRETKRDRQSIKIKQLRSDCRMGVVCTYVWV